MNVQRVRTRWAAIFVLCCDWTLQGQTAQTIRSDDYRPLADALDQTEHLFGTGINYEDPPVENRADIGDVSTAEQRAANPGYWLPAPRRGEVFATVASPNDKGDGNLLAVSSPLDVRIIVPHEKRVIVENVAAILRAVSEASGVRVDVGTVPLFSAGMAFGADDEPARDALARLFTEATGAARSYRLLFDPLFKTYMLNMRDAVVVPASVRQPPSLPVEKREPAPPPAPPAPPVANPWFSRAQ